MKKFLISISLLFISCAETITTKNLAVTNSIPDHWKYDIPNSTEIAGKWWEAFEDSTLDDVFLKIERFFFTKLMDVFFEN